jgi:fructan beta-fructosidase
MNKTLASIIVVLWVFACTEKQPVGSVGQVLEREKHRPLFHFTPDSMWMNDPNGLVYYENTYHLFYQYYPDSTVWGPMHWGHATSTDMIRWQHQPVALYPDDLGYIFSGSAVFDKANTTQFGTLDNPPLVAIFTYHDPVAAEQNPAMSQHQGLAYSLDKGVTWEKYSKNPVLLSPGINDFRDPKVRWHEASSSWIMTLAVKDHIRFYSSPNMKEWQLESEFGHDIGAHGGVWECPDLFPLSTGNGAEEIWVLIVSLNPGGPNRGSATQYFLGEFDGSEFIPLDTNIRWLDYGPDNYAGVTWSNTGSRTLFIGWMSNWDYAQMVPTEKWRSAMTLPRELKLSNINGGWVVSSTPVPEFDLLDKQQYEMPEFQIDGKFNLSEEISFQSPTFAMDIDIMATNDFEISIHNHMEYVLSVRYEKSANRFIIDRSKTGDTAFHPEFGEPILAPRIAISEQMDLKIIVDVASIELFADDGTTVMTAIFFPEEVLDQISFNSSGIVKVSKLVLKDIL